MPFDPVQALRDTIARESSTNENGDESPVRLPCQLCGKAVLNRWLVIIETCYANSGVIVPIKKPFRFCISCALVAEQKGHTIARSPEQAVRPDGTTDNIINFKTKIPVAEIA